MNRPALVIYREADRLLPYRRALEAAGLDVFYSKPEDTQTLDGFSGLVLTGGTDVDPSLYGAIPAPETDAPDRPRDEIEVTLLREALDRDLPVLAICRGMQMLNVYHGGSLCQHLADVQSHRKRTADPSDPVHSVAVEPGSLLADLAGGQPLKVNSRHHQAVERVGEGLRVTARALDGLVEGLERLDRTFVIAVQWHPEDQVFRFPEQLSLFARFGQAVSGRNF